MLSLIAGAYIYLHPVDTIKIEKVESRYTVELRIEKERQERIKATQGVVVLVRPDKTNNCVQWAKQQTGITRQLGYGGMMAIQGKTPKVGSIGVLKGHAVVVKEIAGNYLVIEESNLKKGWVTSRVIPLNSFLGFIYS